MFTGIVKEIGQVQSIIPNAEGLSLVISSKNLSQQLEVDDSVSINGVCQTVVSKKTDAFMVQAVHVTLEKTNFRMLKLGEYVNLEKALTLSQPLGGHIVQGHINGMATVLSVSSKGKNYDLDIALPSELLKYCILEGSIAINGVSLTISHLDSENSRLSVSLIPHTWENTIFSYIKIGDKVNIEVDVLAKYVENLLKYNNKESLSLEKIKSLGF